MKKNSLIVLILSIFLILLCLLSIKFGSITISTSDIINSIFKSESVKSNTAYIIKNLRLPRVLGAVLAGAILSVCGLIYQCVFRNPMADSYVLGISSGASCFVALAFSLGLDINNSTTLPLIAMAGSLSTAIFLLYSNRKSTYTLLLSGIAINFFLSAATTLFVYIGKKKLDSILFWTMGNVTNTTWIRVIILLCCLLLLTILTINKSQVMDILLLDDSTALSSGVNIKNERMFLLVLSSACTALVVSFCGVIGFIGLMSPHIGRLLIGPKHKKLIPISMLTGANLLLLSDLISKVVISPSELPVGLITSVLGAPLFFILLKRNRNGR